MGTKYNPRIVTNGLVFSFDAANRRSYAGSGNTAYSLIGNSFGSLTNGVGFTTSNSGSFIFDGTNDYIPITNIPSTYWTGGSWSVEFCIYNNNPTSGDYGILGTAGQTHFLIRNGLAWLGLFGNDVGSTFQITTTAWTHIVFCYRSDNYDKQIYINGVINNSSIGTAINVNGANTQIGKVSWGYNYYNGKLAFIRFYQKLLSATEVKQNYNATKRRYEL